MYNSVAYGKHETGEIRHHQCVAVNIDGGLTASSTGSVIGSPVSSCYGRYFAKTINTIYVTEKYLLLYKHAQLTMQSTKNKFISRADRFERQTQINGGLLPALGFLERAREINHNRYSWNLKK